MILILDSLSICHAAKHAMKTYPLSTEEMRTEVIFIFMQKLLSLGRRFDTNDFVFAWDSQKNFRKRINSDYKSNRTSSQLPEDIRFNSIAFDQFSTIRRVVVPSMGFQNNFIQTGYEADDIIASIVKKNPSQKFAIVSPDNDMNQLLTENVSQFNHIQNKRIFKATFIKKWGIPPSDWPTVKALAGCSSDNVIGLDGVGEKTAVKYILGTLGEKTIAYRKIKENEDQLLKKNLPLVKLPMKNTHTFPLQSNNLSLSNFMAVFHRFGFVSMLKPSSIEKWKEVFLA